MAAGAPDGRGQRYARVGKNPWRQYANVGGDVRGLTLELNALSEKRLLKLI